MAGWQEEYCEAVRTLVCQDRSCWGRYGGVLVGRALALRGAGTFVCTQSSLVFHLALVHGQDQTSSSCH